MRNFGHAFSLLVLTLVLGDRPAFAQYSYEVTLQATHSPNYEGSLGGCYAILNVVPCSQYLTNLPGGAYNPIEGFAVGQYSSIDMAIVARSGPIEVSRSEEVSFAMILDGDLIKARVGSDGSRTVTNGCPGPDCNRCCTGGNHPCRHCQRRCRR